MQLLGSWRGESPGRLLQDASARTRQSLLWVRRDGAEQPAVTHKRFTEKSLLVSFLLHRIAHVEKAADALAIDTLLISDKLFRYILSSLCWLQKVLQLSEVFYYILCFTLRHQDVPTRSRYVRLVDNVRDNGGTVR